MVHFSCPMISSISHYCTVSTFHSPITIWFKNGTFSLCLSGEAHGKYGQEGFLHLTYVERKHQSDEHNQAGASDFQRLIWIFWVCWLSPVWYNVDCSQLMFSIWSLSTSTGLPNHGASSSEKSPVQDFANHFWHVQSITAPSPYTAQIFFLHLGCIFAISEIIKHNMLKMLLFFFHLWY